MPISSWTADRRQVRVRRGQLGFTLLELLTVLAVVSLVIAVALPHLPKRADVIAVRAAAQEVADGLRQSRGLAIRADAAILFTLDVAARRWRVEGGRGGRLPEDIQLALETDRRLVGTADVGAIRFFADGSATGGRVELGKGGESAVVTVDWLTGKVAVDD